MNRSPYCKTPGPMAWRALAAAGMFLAFSGAAFAQTPENIGRVTAQAFEPRSIAVPPFEVKSGQLAGGPTLAEVVSNDLILSGFFSLPRNQQFVQEIHALDLKEQKIRFKDWHTSGVSYVVKGNYTVTGDQLEAEVRTFDAAAGTYIFGKRYVKYRVDEVRRMAHYIANDIIERVTGFPGVAHTQLVFIRDTGQRSGRQTKEVFVMGADGQNVRQLTTDANLAATPTWGANGTEIYYTTYKDYNPDLAGIFLDGSYSWFVSRRPGFNLAADWANKKKILALTLTKDGNSEIYTMNREGKNLKRLTYNKAIDSSPVWSPASDQIAFTSDRTGKPQIFIMDEGGVNVRQLTRMDYCDAAAWSPKGDRLAFTARVNGIFQIFTIGADGADLQQLTNTGSHSEDPVWAPNGWVIAYTSEKGGTKQIQTMFADGRPIAQLTQGAASYSPNWSPMLP